MFIRTFVYIFKLKRFIAQYNLNPSNIQWQFNGHLPMSPNLTSPSKLPFIISDLLNFSDPVVRSCLRASNSFWRFLKTSSCATCSSGLWDFRWSMETRNSSFVLMLFRSSASNLSISCRVVIPNKSASWSSFFLSLSSASTRSLAAYFNNIIIINITTISIILLL